MEPNYYAAAEQLKTDPGLVKLDKQAPQWAEDVETRDDPYARRRLRHHGNGPHLERECDVEVLLRLGYGACSLQAAVSMEDPAQKIEDLEGRRIATSHPRIAARALADRGIEAELVQVTGSVEISPRLGLADAIIDLVSTGSTLRTNGLRSIGTFFDSEAVLVGESDRRITRLVARSRWCSVRSSTPERIATSSATWRRIRLDEVTALLPTSGSPTIMDLATPGVVAVHALVPAAEIWSLLPKLEAAGASSILTLPVERMVK